MSELLPCPFCNAPAIKPSRASLMRTGCSNEACPNDALMWPTEWNTRPASEGKCDIESLSRITANEIATFFELGNWQWHKTQQAILNALKKATTPTESEGEK